MSTYSTALSGVHAPRFLRTLGAIGRALALLPISIRRVNEFTELNAMSDKALEKQGLKREDLARHVFADLIGK